MIKMYATSLSELIQLMQATEQTDGLDVLEHGHSVNRAYRQILSGEIDDPKLTPLLSDLIPNQLDLETMSRYQIYHDCGKPICATKDAQGRRHFPDHELHSWHQWTIIDPNDEVVAALMAHDMDFHRLRGDELKQLWKYKHADSLYLTAWASITANAEMFGGQNSDSYKIKRKHLLKAWKYREV